MKKLLITLLAVGFAAPVWAIEVCWQAPTENIDDTPLTDLAGYQLFVDGVLEVDAIPPTETCVQVVRPAGEYNITMLAYDDEDPRSESALSNVFVHDTLPPKPPVIVSVTVTVQVN